MATYDINGVLVGEVMNDHVGEFSDNMHLDYCFDEESNANYTVIRVFKKLVNGKKQYPFVYAPNGVDAASDSTLSMNRKEKFNIAINAGLFDVSTNKPRGVIIESGTLILDSEAPINSHPLTIDQNGDLYYASHGVTGAELISNNIVSAVSGWGPIIVDYTDDILTELENAYNNQTNAQRQIIGQFGNGDYAIVTCEGRDYDHSDGWTISEAVNICKKIGLKFAYNLDGGGSTETVIGLKQINTIYELSEGRIVPTYICFNGDTSGVTPIIPTDKYHYDVDDGLLIIPGSMQYVVAETDTKLNTDASGTRRCIVVDSGVKPFVSLSDGSDTLYYPIPIPSGASTVSVSVSPSSMYLGIRIVQRNNNKYANVYNNPWEQGSCTLDLTSMTAQSTMYLTCNIKYDNSGTSFPSEPTDVVVDFS